MRIVFSSRFECAFVWLPLPVCVCVSSCIYDGLVILLTSRNILPTALLHELSSRKYTQSFWTFVCFDVLGTHSKSSVIRSRILLLTRLFLDSDNRRIATYQIERFSSIVAVCLHVRPFGPGECKEFHTYRFLLPLSIARSTWINKNSPNLLYSRLSMNIDALNWIEIIETLNNSKTSR